MYKSKIEILMNMIDYYGETRVQYAKILTNKEVEYKEIGDKLQEVKKARAAILTLLEKGEN